ncbi:MAG: TDP-fucosamine acetyltransferase [Candidatus Scalindua rubra]|uniref:TDP-fucosamine acetyltransferase n=1 Tax=Candidatus Scalindua rubra TaxID=1872076 RepID=A0A1E3XFP7_9BACT|nr:MAG: TDP-fucosamine acetyltransferase [Candidatus Scalindua rubra]
MVYEKLGKFEVLKYDKWLSEILNRDAYCLNFRQDYMEILMDENSKEFIDFNRYLSESPIFIYCKIPALNITIIKFLESRGFNLVDTNVTFEKNINKNRYALNDKSIRLANSADCEKVVLLANGAFHFSRFHLDPLIPKDLADKIKGEWANNYFLGKRGDKMFIKIVNDQIVGFLQLLKDANNVVIIDLIAVDKNHRRDNIACDLIAYAELEYRHSQVIRTGTQVANIPSIKLYEKLGFRLVDSQYIFHYHN